MAHKTRAPVRCAGPAWLTRRAGLCAVLGQHDSQNARACVLCRASCRHHEVAPSLCWMGAWHRTHWWCPCLRVWSWTHPSMCSI